jgi:segregation and condensation protein B
MSLAPAGSNQKMTLRRFVRVTFDNFRQLLQTIAAPVTAIPMPDLTSSPNGTNALSPASTELLVLPAHAIQAPTELAAMDATTDAFSSDTFGSDTLGSDTAGDTAAGEEAAGQDAFGEKPSGEDTADNAGKNAGEDTVDAAAVLDADAGDAVGGALTESAQETIPETVPETVPETTAVPVASLSLPAALESLLFVSDEAVEPLQLARALGLAPEAVEAGLQALDAAYRAGGRGLRLQTRNGRFQLVSAPEAANLIESFLNLDMSAKLSAPALETLAVVAYRQPVTRAQIEAVRGVDCSGVLRSLLQRGLLEEVGRLDAPGRPVLYGVTDLFMHHFGLTALHELPPLEAAELSRIEDTLEQQP